MELERLKAGMILKDKLVFEDETVVFEKGLILTSDHISLLQKTGLAEIDVIPLPDISNEYKRQIYQSYVKLDFCFKNHENNDLMLDFKDQAKQFMYEYLANCGENLSNG